MEIFKSFRKSSVFLLILSFLFAFWGCSSGGGSSSSGGGDVDATGLSYTGATSEATVDGDNAQALTEDALSGGSTSFGGGRVAGAATSGTQKVQKPIKLALMMKNLIGKIRISPPAGGGAVGAIQSMSDTIDGSGGGTADFSISVDTVSGDFTGSITFNSFSEVGVTYDGSAGFSGVAIFVDEEFQGYIDSFTFDYDSVTCSSFGTSFTIDGTMAFADFYYEWPYPYVTMNMVYRDEGTGKTYQMVNFVISFDFEWLGSEDDGFYYRIEGTFYHPDYGYVTLTTTQDIWQYVYDAYPSYEGELIVTGAIGSGGGNTYARLVIGQINYNTYEIYADIDGDGFDPGTGDPDDYYSGELAWVIF